MPAKKEEGLKATTLNLYNSAIRFFYRNVLHILWDDITVPRMILEHKLPTVLTASEIDRLLSAVDDIKYKAMFAIMYSSGMRVSEVIHLHYDDISRSNMQIHVRDTKNRMDRYTILSKRCLDILTRYWFEKGRPRGILFPNKFTGNYLTFSEQPLISYVSIFQAWHTFIQKSCYYFLYLYFLVNWRYISLSCEYQSILSKQSVLLLSKCLITVLLFCYGLM